MPKAALLLYDPAPSLWASKVRQLCAIQGLRFSAVDTAQLDRPIRDLAQGLPPTGQGPSGPSERRRAPDLPEGHPHPNQRRLDPAGPL